jgi:hypothetical protein
LALPPNTLWLQPSRTWRPRVERRPAVICALSLFDVRMRVVVSCARFICNHELTQRAILRARGRPAEHDGQPHMQKVDRGTEPYSQREAVPVHRDKRPWAYPTTIEKSADYDEPTNHPVTRKRRRRWIVGGIIVGLVTVCAVIGGVLGSLLTKKNHSASAPQATDG